MGKHIKNRQKFKQVYIIMKQGNNNKHFIADEGKVFQRINNGFVEIAKPVILGSEIILGNIIVDKNSNLLDKPIEDKIEYYIEVDAPAKEENEMNKD